MKKTYDYDRELSYYNSTDEEDNNSSDSISHLLQRHEQQLKFRQSREESIVNEALHDYKQMKTQQSSQGSTNNNNNNNSGSSNNDYTDDIAHRETSNELGTMSHELNNSDNYGQDGGGSFESQLNLSNEINNDEEETLESYRKRKSMLESSNEQDQLDYIKRPSEEEMLALQKLEIGNQRNLKDIDLLQDMGSLEHYSAIIQSHPDLNIESLEPKPQVKSQRQPNQQTYLTDEEALLINARDSYHDLMHILATPKPRSQSFSSISNFPPGQQRSDTSSLPEWETEQFSSLSHGNSSVLITNIQTGVPIKRKLRKQREEKGCNNNDTTCSNSNKRDNKYSPPSSKRSTNSAPSVTSSARNRSDVTAQQHSQLPFQTRQNHLDPSELRRIIAKKIKTKESKEFLGRGTHSKKPIYHGAGGLAFNPNKAFTLSHLYEHIEKERKPSKSSKRKVILKKKSNSTTDKSDGDLLNPSSEHYSPHSFTEGDNYNPHHSYMYSNSDCVPPVLSPEKSSETGAKSFGNNNNSSSLSDDSDDEEEHYSMNSIVKKAQRDADSWLHEAASEELKRETIQRARRLALSKHFSDSVSSSEEEDNSSNEKSSYGAHGTSSSSLVSRKYSTTTPTLTAATAATARNISSSRTTNQRTAPTTSSKLQTTTATTVASSKPSTAKSVFARKTSTTAKKPEEKTRVATTAGPPTTTVVTNSQPAARNVFQKMENEEIEQFRKLLDKGESEADLDEDDDDFFEARSLMQRISMFRSYVGSGQ